MTFSLGVLVCDHVTQRNKCKGLLTKTRDICFEDYEIHMGRTESHEEGTAF